MRGDRLSQSFLQTCIVGVEIQKSDNGPSKILDVLGLHFFPTTCTSRLTLRIGSSGAFGLKVGPNLFDRGGKRPHTFRKSSPTFLFLHNPVLTSRFHTSSQRSVTWFQQLPTRRNIQHCTIGSSNRV
jgi:hypothetical protein